MAGIWTFWSLLHISVRHHQAASAVLPRHFLLMLMHLRGCKLPREVDENWVIAQLVVAIPYRRFGTTYWSHLQGRQPISPIFPLKMGLIGCL